MYRKYNREQRYSERDAILHLLEINNEILSELIKMNKLIKKGETIKRSPVKENKDKIKLSK
jgi:hypothetical protein